MNKIIITGRLTADPDVKVTTNGTSVVDITLAVDRGYNKGEKVTDFIAVQAWRQTAEFIGRNFTKGKPMLCVGQLICDKWTDKEGKRHDNWKVKADEVEFYGTSAANAGDQKETEKTDGNDDEFDESALPF